MLAVQTLVEDKDTYLTRPDLGRVLSEASLQTVRERYKPVPQVLIVLSDGLSTDCLLYTSPSPRDTERSRMPSWA